MIKFLGKVYYKIVSKIFEFIGDMTFQGWKHPLWFVYKPTGYKVKNVELYDLNEMVFNKILQPGDILLRRYDKYWSSFRLCIPGDLKHAGIFYGWDKDGKAKVIHSVSEGVLKEHIFDFWKSDHIAIVRPRGLSKEERLEAADIASVFVGKPYDFAFKYHDDQAFYCTELVGRCYEMYTEKFKFKMDTAGFGPWKRKVLLADGIFKSDVDIIFMNKSIEKMKVWEDRNMGERS